VTESQYVLLMVPGAVALAFLGIVAVWIRRRRR